MKKEVQDAVDSPTVQQGLGEFMDKLNTAIDVVSKQLVHVAPDVAQGLLHLVQFKGIFSIGANFILFMIGFTALLAIINKMGPWAAKKEDAAKYGDSGQYMVMTVIAFIAAGIATLIGFFSLLSFYDWLSAFYPEGALAYKALEAAGINL